ncbi:MULTISPECIES: helix-turn-helix transcriptional regulator [Paenibacillus]|uniref:Transcriptional regulator with XRE-family HTH domain n=1 Tax=Paenibacillus xylanexedens TaxID=528191 RepID=A0ABS4RM19_PAEXY|nr:MULTISPECIES: helix-turn-helix transcriptional regulator [Paenibacillus]MBP2243848.1 transcriptional regulator with XRE-family HTH domain [Paenibacillus xylanexedens]UPK42506.1 helix-turn-helix transcriptional regulator [Paenibacillus pabuli]
MRHWLVQMRKAKGLTQNDAAKQSGISRSYYAEIEQGRKDASGRAAKLISATLGFDMNLFFADVGRETSQKPKKTA